MERTNAEGRFRPLETQRLDAFVDAAFAFAVSLLRIPAFLAGFALALAQV